MKDHDAAASRPLVLVADDDATGRFLLRSTLEGEGFRVEEAADGAEAISRFDASRPDLVVLDVVMPGMNGFEACAALRSRPGGEIPPILMLTGLEDVESIQRAYQAGATDFATKPLSWVVLSHRVRYMLRAQKTLMKLRQSEKRLAETQRIAQLGYWEWEKASGRIRWSSEVQEILGLAMGRPETSLDDHLDLVHPADREMLRRCRADAVERLVPYGVDLRVIRPDGGLRFIHEQAEVLRGPKGEVRGLNGTIQDITARTETEARVRFLDRHDALTRLLNRAAFADWVQAALTRERRPEGRLAVLSVDLDHFKRFSDTLGHRESDKLLREMADRLRACLSLSGGGPDDSEEGGLCTLARPSGAAFLAAVAGIADASEAAKLAQGILDALRAPFLAGERELFLSATIGISVSPEDGQDAEALITNAASAISHSGDGARGVYRFFDSGTHRAALQRVTLESQLRRALDRDELRLYYQPQVDAQTKAVVALEALVRWPHSERGMIPPCDFIPLAEETGLIEPLGAWVLRAACAQIRAWRDAGGTPPVVAVNLSAREFLQTNLAARIGQVLGESGIGADGIEIEITESTLMGHGARVVETLGELKAMGIRIAVDDFGTGYSSLAYLRRLPIDCLKIDRAFVRGIPENPDDAAITAAILALARSLKLCTVAEGVETEDQAEFLRARGCDILQGFFFGRPVPAAQLAPFAVAAAGRSEGAIGAPERLPAGEGMPVSG